jgi:hypothetical protein
MSILTDEELITFLQIQIFLEEDFTEGAFRASLLKKYISLSAWVDDEDIPRMQALIGIVPVVPRKAKCTKCKHTQISIDLICNRCYSMCLQLHEGLK